MVDISSGTAVETYANFSIGNIFERSFAILGRNLVPLLVLGGIAAIPYLLIYYFQGDSAFIQPAAKPAFTVTTAILFFVSLLAAFLLRPICQAMILFGAFQDMRGRRFPIGESFQKGLARFFPVIGMLFVEGFGILLGFILLIIPGYMLYMAWYVALPVCVVERLGPIGSLRRSAALTKGHRWKIFGILFVMSIVAGIVGAVIGGVVVVSHNKMIYVVGQYLFQAIYTAFQAVVGVVIYHDLRAAKEGIDTERIAAVFD